MLIRHGETDSTQEDRYTGWRDIDLSAEGVDHATDLGVRLKAFNISAIYSSTMHRAMKTAQLIAASHALLVKTVEGLREIDHGHWDGLTRQEVEQQFPGEYEQYEKDPANFRPGGGESALDVLNRAAPALLEIVRAHPDAAVAVVAHKATNRILIAHFIGVDLSGYRAKLAQRPACLNVLDFKDEQHIQLFLLNDVSHIEIGAPPDSQYVV